MIELGVFVVPDAEDPAATVAQIVAAEEAGLDLVGVQDHPYQRRFLDTWTLLSYAAGETERIRLVPDVANLPLRPPAVLAKSVASLDVLTGGRVELGLGAGAFWDGVAAMGGPRRTPGESVEALEEAIRIIRAMWSGERSVTVEGKHYAVRGAHPGPAPAHDVGIWIGAYQPRMLRLTGRLADGWIPSLPRMSLDEVAANQAIIDEAAHAAGRDPREVKRIANVNGTIVDDASAEGFLTGTPEHVAAALVRLHRELRFDAFVFSAEGEPVEQFGRFGSEVAPRVRDALA